MTKETPSLSTAMTGRWRSASGTCSRSSSGARGRFQRLSSGTAASPNGPRCRPKPWRHRRFSTATFLLSASPPMLSGERARAGGHGLPSYADVLSPGLFDPAYGTPADLTGPNGKGAVKRYNVYRNNVTVSLIDALAAVFPATQRITGAAFFRAMARFHIRATPPRSPLLFEYGRDFPRFIETYEYAQPMPWLADVARVARAWLDAYHAADADPLSAATLGSFPPEPLADPVF